jgi:hypothetical protein
MTPASRPKSTGSRRRFRRRASSIARVCALLFFRFGQTPTANRLYQLVKRGSMGTPAAVLGEFWTELREKSRVRIGVFVLFVHFLAVTAAEAACSKAERPQTDLPSAQMTVFP